MNKDVISGIAKAKKEWDSTKKALYCRMGEAMRMERKRRGMTQPECVQSFLTDDPDGGMNTATWSKYENGKAKIPYILLSELHEKWGMDLNEMFSGVKMDESELELHKAAKSVIKFLENHLELQD